MTAQPAPRLARLLETVLAGAGTDLDLRCALRHIVEGAAELTGADHADLDVADPAGNGPPGIRAPAPGRPGTPAGQEEEAGAQAAFPRLRVPVLVGDEEVGELRLTGRPGAGAFTTEDEQLLRVLATQAGISIGNARLYETARQRERWIEGAAAVTTALLTEESADDALTTVAERARLLADASAGVILHPTAEGGMEIVTASTPDDPDGMIGATIAPGSPVLEQLLGGEPVFLTDSATDPRMTTHVRHRFGPSMMLPLQANGRLIGTLALPRRRGARQYTDLERLLATQFASQAALALVLADARRGRERLAVYEDRDRIARDLHDLVVQRLFATGMMLESTERRRGAEDVRDILVRAVDALRSTVQEVRTTIFALQQPPAEPPTGLRGRVLRETASAADRLGLAPSTHFRGAVDTRVPAPVADRLVTALRHALADVCARKEVSRVEVTVDTATALADGRAGVRLTVFDDGTDGGSGSLSGGTESGSADGGGRRGEGTTVTWWSPL
ncbi:GAF domain-containing sensor histidine kinase [Streptomyces sp. NPDC057245]|uniref:GAF domain-containing sensor histidine kinase n=1 Tax=Streptomyces TaxID=1883 RepID=UPI001C1E7194|nr:GAF domain-containing protein [Streptomyces sp. A108]MBU6533024.1 GAF domain-containing protein [Streptomyces sp. A108]